MAELILLNGPPASGKSTLAQRYVDDHPLALNLDIDRVRAMLGQWMDRPVEAGLAARALTLALASSHLRAGHDVIIAQYLGRLAFIEQLDQLAVAEGVRLRELVLLDSKANLLRRFDDRTAAAAEPAHVEADASLRAWGGPAGLADMYDRLLDVIEQRPNTQVIRPMKGSPNALIGSCWRRSIARLRRVEHVTDDSARAFYDELAADYDLIFPDWDASIQRARPRRSEGWSCHS